ncbi:hypothetical protein F4604DRAFT_1920019 [Suillus subluteus]|nr:hypothetical protein F4604DRAFT_1920019 [Suillus subluteus]
MVKSINLNRSQSRPYMPTTIANDDVPSSMRPQFSLTGVAAIYPHSFVDGFSNTERQAAVRALLRHDAHIDGTHFHTRKRGGLHPSYIAFNSHTSADEKSITHEELVEAALQDIFDAIVMQDWLDGGILFLFIATALKPQQHSRQNTSLWTFTLCLANCMKLQSAWVEMYQCWHKPLGKSLQFPTCNVSLNAVISRALSLRVTVNPAAPPHLPAPMVATGACIHCSACPSRQFKHDLQVDLKSKTPPSSAVREGREMALANKGTTPCVNASPRENKICRHRHADTFFSDGLKVPGPEIEAPSSVAPLISIGPHTDAIIDRFKMDDTVLLRLHQLIRSVCSSRWEAVLHSPEWNLTYEEVSKLTHALIADIQGTAVITKVLLP